MWNQAKSNRIVYEREKVKDHVMHIERLRQIKPVMSITAPRKASHLKTNAKREMQNLGKLLPTECLQLILTLCSNRFVERISEIQYQNRILLRKMLQIDLNKSKNVQATPTEVKESNPNGLNSYQSLNRAVRIKEIARVADQNRNILGRLQNTRSHYSNEAWEQHHKSQRKNLSQIEENGDRFCRNPYFLHSVSTMDNVAGMDPYQGAATYNSKSIIKSNRYYFLEGARNHSTQKSSKRAGSSKRVRSGLPAAPMMMDRIDKQRGKSMRPFSAPKHSNMRRPSSNKRSQSGKARKVNAYMSDQEAAHMALQQQLMQEQMMQQQQQMHQEEEAQDYGQEED